MSREPQEEKMCLELNPDNLERVSGGVNYLKQLINRIYADGHAEELKTLLKTKGKTAAAAKCGEYYPDLIGYAAAVTMLK